MQLFELLGRNLSFRQTAESIGIAQPALTRAIQQLESELGFKLFERSRRGTMLTPAGALLHERVCRWIQEMDATVKDCRLLAEGPGEARLTLGCTAQSSNGVMTQLLYQFSSIEKQEHFNLRVIPSENAYAGVADGTLDGAFLIHDEELLTKYGLGHVPIEVQRMVALCGTNHPLARRKTISVRVFQEWPVVIGTKFGWEVFRRVVLPQLESAGVNLNIVREVTAQQMLFEMMTRSNEITLSGSGASLVLPPGITSIGLKERLKMPICFTFASVSSATIGRFVDYLKVTAPASRSM
ncbi:LysR family transcriptional regulator [Burkholderia sp. GS2Y]|uniref:LysR family transcriptional regulator n=1 Tax=Burkholderia theae TaxID=3143496 RepID=A0ABU9WRV2_9BURK